MDDYSIRAVRRRPERSNGPFNIADQEYSGGKGQARDVLWKRSTVVRYLELLPAVNHHVGYLKGTPHCITLAGYCVSVPSLISVIPVKSFPVTYLQNVFRVCSYT